MPWKPHAASKAGSSWKNPRFSAASVTIGSARRSLRPQGHPQLESRILVYPSRRYQHVVGPQDHALVASPLLAHDVGARQEDRAGASEGGRKELACASLSLGVVGRTATRSVMREYARVADGGEVLELVRVDDTYN